MVYEFRCKLCNITEEVQLKPSEVCGYTHPCNSCGKPMQRIFTPPGIRFIGPGFHVNDYPKKRTT